MGKHSKHPEDPAQDPKAKRKAANAAAAKRYRLRLNLLRQNLLPGDLVDPSCQLQSSGRPRTKNPALRTVQKHAADFRSQMRATGHDWNAGDADSRRYEHLVMAACQKVPGATAARVGFAMPPEPVFMGGKFPRIFPSLEVRVSGVPGAGAGVFAGEDIRKNAFVCEYHGALRTWKEAEQLRRSGQDTHARTLGYSTAWVLDGRLSELMPIETYKLAHRVGSFLNATHPRETNTKYVTWVKDGSATEHVLPDGQKIWLAQRCFLQATRDIRAGEELFVNYGPTYKTLHLTPQEADA